MHVQGLNKQLRIPLYHQLKAILRDQIRTGMLKPNDRLPAEEVMASQCGVSKATVRQALNELAYEGLLRRAQGLGTFIAEPKVKVGPRQLTSFSAEMRARKLQPSSRVLKKEIIIADGELAERLQVLPGSQLLCLERLRLADNQPMGIQTAYIPLFLAPALAQEQFERISLYRVLEEKYGLIPARARETHYAVLMNEEQAELLHTSPGSPALAARRLTWLATGQPLELVESIMHGERYEIVLDLVADLPDRTG